MMGEFLDCIDISHTDHFCLCLNCNNCTIPSANPNPLGAVPPKPLCPNPLLSLKSATNPYNLAHGSGVATSKTMQTST